MYEATRAPGGSRGLDTPGRTGWRSRAALLAAAVGLLASCSAAELSPAAAALRVEALVSGLRVAEVDRVLVTVSAGDGEAFAPIELTASRLGDRWGVALDQVPAGAQRQFDVRALDVRGEPILVGGARADVLPGVGATIVVVLQEPAPPPRVATPPVVRSVVVWGSVVAPGKSAVLQATAEAPPGQAYLLWSSRGDCGYFEDIEAATTHWWALGLNSGEACWITLTVANEMGDSVQVGLPVFVEAPAP